ncbi:MAG TPA: HAMP domain-containing sensor histidine kinase [Candidatus Polarisedimenticolaceae bacterium]|nr:HAMP domain-containing sensor histidine kinase [Candidatus Polarisedimenticolaceae bacterium]
MREGDSAAQEFNLLRYFTGACLLIVLVGSLATAVAAAALVRRVGMQLEIDEADSLVEDLVVTFREAGFGITEWPQAEAPPELRTRLLEEMRNFGIRELTLYDLEGRPLEDLLGPGVVPPPLWREGLAEARQGRTAIRWEPSPDGRTRLQTYVPVRAAEGIEAVARLRRDLSPAMESARRALPVLVLLALTAGCGMCGALWLLVRKADRTLRAQRAELVHRARLLEELSRKKDELYAMCSHDLRSPLLSIHAGCKLALGDRGGRLTDLQREVVEENLRRTEGLLELVDELLDLARPERPAAAALKPEPVRLGSLLDAVATTHRSLAASRGTVLQVELPEQEITVHGDRSKLLRVFANLLSNAIKHAGSLPVTVRLTRQPGRAAVEVVDRGPGIDPERLPRIFEPYVTGDAGEGGIGLGLAVVRQFVELHGGEVTVESRAGLGTTFRVLLPLAPVGVPVEA